MDIGIIQNILSEFPFHNTDIIVKQLKHISALYEVLRILFFQAQFSDTQYCFPGGVSNIVTIAAGINTVRPEFESGRWAKSKVQNPVPIWFEGFLDTALEELAAALT